MTEFRVQGLVAATSTPFDSNGDVQLDRIEPYCQFLHDAGVKHVYVNGATGEGLSMTLGERKAVAEEWMKVNKGRLETIMVHVGCANLRDTRELARHAAEIKADAIAAIPPLFFKPATVEHLVEYLAQVGDAAPHLPLYLYHIPPCTGSDLNMADFLKVGRDVIPSLRGVKFSSLNHPVLTECCQLKDSKGCRFNILYGCDQDLVSGLTVGADGGIGSTYNYMPGLYQRLMEAREKGDTDTVRLEQYRSVLACNLLVKYATKAGGSVGCHKQMMSFAGFDVGPPRSPLRNVDKEDIPKYKKDLEDIGFFDWCKK